jgi:hypothetical protein
MELCASRPGKCRCTGRRRRRRRNIAPTNAAPYSGRCHSTQNTASGRVARSGENHSSSHGRANPPQPGSSNPPPRNTTKTNVPRYAGSRVRSSRRSSDVSRTASAAWRPHQQYQHALSKPTATGRRERSQNGEADRPPYSDSERLTRPEDPGLGQGQRNRHAGSRADQAALYASSPKRPRIGCRNERSSSVPVGGVLTRLLTRRRGTRPTPRHGRDSGASRPASQLGGCDAAEPSRRRSPSS